MKNERFEEYFAKYRNLVFRLVLDKTGDYQTAQEICQQVFVSFYPNMDVVGDDLVKAWLLKCAKNAVIDFYRKRQMGSESLDSSPMHEQGNALSEKNLEACEERMIYRDFVGRILREVKKKNEGWYEVMVLHCVDGLSYEEMEERLQTSETVLRARLYRARCYIREQFGKEYREL